VKRHRANEITKVLFAQQKCKQNWLNSVCTSVGSKIEALGASQDITIEPVLISASGATGAVQRTGFFQSILTLSDLV